MFVFFQTDDQVKRVKEQRKIWGKSGKKWKCASGWMRVCMVCADVQPFFSTWTQLKVYIYFLNERLCLWKEGVIGFFESCGPYLFMRRKESRKERGLFYWEKCWKTCIMDSNLFVANALNMTAIATWRKYEFVGQYHASCIRLIILSLFRGPERVLRLQIVRLVSACDFWCKEAEKLWNWISALFCIITGYMYCHIFLCSKAKLS